VTSGVVARIVLWPLRRPWTTIVLTLAISIAAAFGWNAVAFEPDVSRLLPADHPHVKIAQMLDERSRPSRSLWILLRGDGVAARIAPIAQALRASPLVADVAATRTELLGAAAANAAKAPLWALADDELDRLADALAPDARARAIASLRADLADDPIAARELATRDPLGLRWFFAEKDLSRALGLRADSEFVVFGSGDAALLRVTGTKDAYDAEYAVELLAHVEKALAGGPYELFGGYVVARGDQARVKADFARASTWSVVAIAIYLCWVMRGVRLPLLVQLPSALSILWAVPFGCLVLGALPTVAVGAVAVLCGLGVDFAIHYAGRYRHERLHKDHAAAVAAVQVGTVPELLIDMATTAVTFVAIGFGQRGGLSAFGWLLALGLVASLLVTTTLLPVLLRFAGNRRDPEQSWLATAADRWLARGVWARRTAIVAIVLVVAIAVAVACRGVPLSADGDALRPADDPVLAARERIEHRLGFSTVPAIVLWPQREDASPLWQALHDMQVAGEVRFWSGLDRAATARGRDAVAAFRAHTQGLAAAARAELAAAGFAPDAFAPALDELAASFARDPEPANATEIDLDGERRRVVTVWPGARLDRARFVAFAAEIGARAGPAAIVHGSATLTAAIEQMLRGDLMRACVWAAALAVVMVTLWLRSLPRGLLALLPSSIGLVVTLGALLATGLPLSIVSFVAVPFVLGIGVDEGVHLVGHFRHGASATGHTGVGVVRTSLGTVLGFGSLLFADSPGLVHLGGLVALGSFASMLACLFVLAPLLARHRGV
jgi:predicted RND superfamily exporter protein